MKSPESNQLMMLFIVIMISDKLCQASGQYLDYDNSIANLADQWTIYGCLSSLCSGLLSMKQVKGIPYKF